MVGSFGVVKVLLLTDDSRTVDMITELVLCLFEYPVVLLLLLQIERNGWTIDILYISFL